MNFRINPIKKPKNIWKIIDEGNLYTLYATNKKPKELAHLTDELWKSCIRTDLDKPRSSLNGLICTEKAMFKHTTTGTPILILRITEGPFIGTFITIDKAGCKKIHDDELQNI
jgi:hypothetical protein